MSNDAVLFPDSIALVIGIINDGYVAQDIDVVVDTTVPTPRPDEFVVVRRVGGPQRDLVTDEPLLTLEASAQTEFRARQLLDYARAFVKAARGTVRDGASIYSVHEISGPADLPDPVAQIPRSSATWQLAVRGTAL